MHPSAPGHLNELRELAGRLFEVVCEHYTTGAPVMVTFDRVDDLVEKDIEEQHLVATALLCAQLLHRVTAEPEQTSPRHVQTLTDIIDQVIPSLAMTGSRRSAASEALLTVGDSIAQTAFSLLVLSDPDGPGYEPA
jgi:hypothetical protein